MFKIVLLALVASLGLRYEAGHGAYYAPNKMKQVIKVRQAGWTAGDLPDPIPVGVSVFIATPF